MNVLKHHIQNEDRELEWALNYNAPNAGTPAWFLYPITLFKTAVQPVAVYLAAVDKPDFNRRVRRLVVCVVSRRAGHQRVVGFV